MHDAPSPGILAQQKVVRLVVPANVALLGVVSRSLSAVANLAETRLSLAAAALEELLAQFCWPFSIRHGLNGPSGGLAATAVGQTVVLMGQVTQVLTAIERREASAAEDLLPMIYDELRHLAAQKLSLEKPGQTLQATALVHEAWLRLLQEGGRTWNDSHHFFNAAAQAMRRILIDNARRKQSCKHGGHMQRVEFDDITPASPMRPDELLALDEALTRLAAEDPDAARLVGLRFFTGLGHQEAAQMMGISRREADELWAYARAWLFEAMRKEFGANEKPLSL